MTYYNVQVHVRGYEDRAAMVAAIPLPPAGLLLLAVLAGLAALRRHATA